MLKAIHKETGLPIWAYALENDATWIGKEKDDFIAPRYMVFDYEEKGDIKVFFTKTHERDGSLVRCHFKHESEREIYDKESESKEHKMAKEGVYEAICNGTISIDNIPLKNLLKDIQFEYPLSNSKKSKIADVIAIFKEWHPIYGKGIVFEVQLSHQIAEITEDRTFNRVTEGYSVCWLWDADFDKSNKIKTDRDRIIIIPFSKALEQYQKTLENKSLTRINEAGLLLDKKILELTKAREDIEEVYTDLKKFRDNINFDIKLKKDKVSKDFEELVKSFSYKINQSINHNQNEIIATALNNFKIEFDRTAEKWKEGVTNQVISRITNSSYIEQVVKEKIGNKIQEALDKELQKNILYNNPKLLSEDNIQTTLKNIILEKITVKPENFLNSPGIIV